jgi:type I restriction enzyme R subunit
LEWIEGDVDVPELTERVNFRQVLLTERLAAALRKINLREGQPWLDEARLTKAIHDLERSPGHRLLEVNQSATEFLLKGTVADGLSDWDHGRPQPLRFIDFEHPENNDFLVINQFKVELTSGRGHVIPDAVLFANGTLEMFANAAAEVGAPIVAQRLREGLKKITDDPDKDKDRAKEVLKTLRKSVLNTAKRFGKARFAQVSARHVKCAETIPKYLGDAVTWLLKE